MLDFEPSAFKTSASIDEIRARVAAAFRSNPLCRRIDFDVLAVPRTRKGSNWTVTIRAVNPEAVWEIPEIVADVQAAYDLAA